MAFLFGSISSCFPEESLGNPLQVIAQLACFLFHPARVRHLFLLGFFLSLVSSLHLKGIDEGVLLFIRLLYLFVLFFVPLDYAHLIVFFGYFLDQGLAKWGFYLAFQQVGYHALSFFLERGQSSATPKTRIYSFLFLVLFQSIYGFGDFYFAEPVKLAALGGLHHLYKLSEARDVGLSTYLIILFYFKPINRRNVISR